MRVCCAIRKWSPFCFVILHHFPFRLLHLDILRPPGNAVLVGTIKRPSYVNTRKNQDYTLPSSRAIMMKYGNTVIEPQKGRCVESGNGEERITRGAPRRWCTVYSMLRRRCFSNRDQRNIENLLPVVRNVLPVTPLLMTQQKCDQKCLLSPFGSTSQNCRC